MSVEKKSADMRKQKKKQDKLIYKMLPKDVVDRLNSGAATAENFESSTVFFSSVVDFAKVTKSCQPQSGANLSRCWTAARLTGIHLCLC